MGKPSFESSTSIYYLFLYIVHVFTSYKKKSCSTKPRSVMLKESDKSGRMLKQGM
jgi:hypothetical protein